MESYESLFRTFSENNLHYLIVGGVAVNLHGYPRFTNDIDILLALDTNNLKKMAKIMVFDTFSTQTMHAEIWGIKVPVVSIDDLIGMKKQSDREKDIQDVIALLELKGL